jgi:DNA-binding Lrp family transcriptional regulator
MGAAEMKKLRTKFVSGGSGETLPPAESAGEPPDEFAMATVRGLQWIGVERRPFDGAAKLSCADADEFMRRTRRLAETGVLRRIGASFDHYRAGWLSNSLCASDLSGASGSAARIARRAARWPWVSHCYIRELYDCDIRGGWPYNLYMMIHAESDEILAERENILKGELGRGLVSLRTTAEYKKIPFKI